MKVSFYGSLPLSLEILKAIYEKHKVGKLELAYIISQPAKPFGRKREIKNNPVAQFAIENNIPLFTPEKLTKFFETETSTDLSTDLAVVVAYGKIISEKVLSTSKNGFINFHPSLLPDYRGAGPFRMTVLNQDRTGGLTIIKMDKEMDSGDIIKQYKVDIPENITAGELMWDLAKLSVEKLNKDFDEIFNAKDWNLQKQDHSKATYCYEKDLGKDKLEIKFEDGVKLAHGKIMSANPEPGAWLTANNIKINIWKSHWQNNTVMDLHKSNSLTLKSGPSKKKLFLELNDGFLEILEIQPEGKKIMDGKSFINGYLRENV